MAKKLSNKVLDVRVSERYIRRGVLSQKDLEGHIKNLPDLEGEYDVVDLDASDANEETDAGETSDEAAALEVNTTSGEELPA